MGSVEVSYTIEVPVGKDASTVVAVLSASSPAAVTKSIQQHLSASELNYETSVTSIATPTIITTAISTTTGKSLLIATPVETTEEAATADFPIGPVAGGLIGGTIAILILGSCWCMAKKQDEQKLPLPAATRL